MARWRSNLPVLAGTLAASWLVFMVMSWPLARHMTEAIPSSAQNVESPPIRAMIPGDHLQLLHHYDLMRDMLHGRIAWFSNPYEFNLGDDAAGYRPGGYFLPMSAVYAAVAERWGQALGWNLTLWLTVAFSAYFSWRWLRRFTDDRLAAALGGAVLLLAPFRWISLLGGSPTGAALMWLPLLAWMLDVAITRGTLASGFGLGFAVFALFWADMQIFYLTMLFVPVWALMSLLGHDERLPWRNWWRPVPGGGLFLILIAAGYLWRKPYLASSTMGGGRDVVEVLLFSPHRQGFLFGGAGADGWIFLGISVVVAMAIAWGRLLAQSLNDGTRRRDWGRFALALVVLLALAGGGGLALGMQSPAGGYLIQKARALLPHYDMIRQPAKIMAPLLMVVAWLVTAGLARQPGDRLLWRRFKAGAAAVCLLGLILEVTASFSATLCLLPPEQGAYDRVAREARRDREGPGHALALPIWPGDSTDTAVPLYFAQKYGLRMVNGYSPIVSPDYVENVFLRLMSFNHGDVTDEQLDFLIERRIRYLLLHENLYPEKVSVFPVGEVLRRLKGHPRVQFLEQDGPVHAFRLLETKQARVGRVPGLRMFPAVFPARQWVAGELRCQGGQLLEESISSSGSVWQIAGRPETETWLATRPTQIPRADDLVWRVRLHGEGQLQAQLIGAEGVLWEELLEVGHNTWHWQLLRPSPVINAQPVYLKLTSLAGEVQVDMVLLSAGNWYEGVWPVDGAHIPASVCFRAGYTDADATSVVLRRDHDPDVELFYGPCLPLPPGRYRVELIFSTDAPEGTVLGGLTARLGTVNTLASTSVVAGQPARLEFHIADNRPFVLRFHYSRAHDMKLHGIDLHADTEAVADAP